MKATKALRGGLPAMLLQFFGERLVVERARMGLTQEEFGRVGGVTRVTQYVYEQNERHPTVEYLTKVVASGADLNYLVLGTRGLAKKYK